jgi:hypothetical protein
MELLAAISLVHLLISFLILIVVIAIIAGLVWCIENWVSPLPPPVKVIIAIILVVLVIIWAVQQFGTGG